MTGISIFGPTGPAIALRHRQPAQPNDSGIQGLIQSEPLAVSNANPDLNSLPNCCGACGLTSFRSVGHKHSFELAQCMSCGSISVRGVEVTEAKPSDIYEHYYDCSNFQTPAVTSLSLNRVAERCEAFRQTGCWLDIGYGEGGLLSIAEAHGWSCYGTEIARRSLEHGRRRGWTVTADAECDARFPQAGFDVITMIEFLEHVTDPGRFLSAAARWLRPGGLLYLTTPNALSLNNRLLGLDWSVFAPPDHVIIWTPAGIRTAFTRYGFRLSSLRTEGLNPCEIKARFTLRQHDGKPGTPINRNDAAANLNEALSRSPLRRGIKRTINQFLSTLKAGDTIKAWAIRE